MRLLSLSFSDQPGRTATPRNNSVGPAVPPNHSGVNRKSPGTLPPNLVNGKGKGKEKATGGPSLDVGELVAHTIAMGLEGEEEEDEPEYCGAGLKIVLPTSPTLPPPDHDLVNHTGIGVHVSGVSAKSIVVEDSLWGDPLEERNKSKDKDKDKKKKADEVLLCTYHGKVCSRGICKVYEKQLREQKEQQKQRELKEPKESQSWRPDNGRGGGAGRGTGGFLLRRRGGFGKDSGPRFPRDGNLRHTVPSFNVSSEQIYLTENEAPRRANGNTPPKNAWGKPGGKPQDSAVWGANNNGWSPSEMGESAKPVAKPDSNPSVKDDAGDEGQLWNAPGTKGWSQSEVGDGSQADPWSGPGKVKSKPDVKPGWTKTPKGPNPTGPPLKSPVKSAWGNSGDAKNWTPSELGLDDSVSQRGDEFRKAPSMEPGKKSWADLVEDGDEMDYASGDEPAPMVAPAPDIGGDEDEDDDSWLEAGKGRGKGGGKGKPKSTTGWSDVTNQGFW